MQGTSNTSPTKIYVFSPILEIVNGKVAFGSVAYITTWNTVTLNISNIVVNSIYSTVNITTIAILRAVTITRRYSAIVAITFCNRLKELFTKKPSNATSLRAILHSRKKNVAGSLSFLASPTTTATFRISASQRIARINLHLSTIALAKKIWSALPFTRYNSSQYNKSPISFTAQINKSHSFSFKNSLQRLVNFVSRQNPSNLWRQFSSISLTEYHA